MASAWGWLFLAWTASIPVMIGMHVRFLHRYTLPFADFIFVAAFAAFLAAVITRRQTLRASTWYWPLAAYAVALGLSTFMAVNVRQSLPKMAGDLYLIAAAVLTVNYVTNFEALRRVLYAWLAGSVLTIAGGIAGLLLFLAGRTLHRQNPFLLPGFGTLPPGHYPRIQSIFLEPSMMCSYLIAAAMILIALRQASWISTAVFRVLLAGALIAGAFSLSPSLGGFFVLAIWLASRQTNRTARRLIAGTAVFFALLVFASTTVSLTHLATAPLSETIFHPEASNRLQTWTGAWHTFLAHPLFGQGLESDSARIHYLTASGILQTLTSAHNTWLSIMAQQGAVGLLAFVWVVVHLVRRFRLWTGPLNQAISLRTTIELAFLGAFLYDSLTGAFENTRHVWALMGLVAAVQEFSGVPEVTAG